MGHCGRLKFHSIKQTDVSSAGTGLIYDPVGLRSFLHPTLFFNATYTLLHYYPPKIPEENIQISFLFHFFFLRLNSVRGGQKNLEISLKGEKKERFFFGISGGLVKDHLKRCQVFFFYLGCCTSVAVRSLLKMVNRIRFN